MYKAVIIGCGGRGKAHARGYAATTEAELLACADPFEAGRSTFQEEFGVPRAYQDYREMLEKEEPDIVSVCTWIGLHREMVEAAVQHASVRAIHCEKPMAPTWADAKALYQACVDNDITITFCHQRRFGACWIKAKALLKAGEIGELVRLEGACSNLLDWGTHWFDMFFFFNDQEPVEWVMGQIDVEGTYDIFGVPVEGSGLSWIRWKNGVEGLLATGEGALQGIHNRLVGSEGTIEIFRGKAEIPMRVRLKGKGDWEVPDLECLTLHEDASVCSILDLVDALKSGREPELSGRKALQATELIFATYESSRRRGKVTLPLEVEDSAFLTMLEEEVLIRPVDEPDHRSAGT